MRFYVNNKRVSPMKIIKSLSLNEYRYIVSDTKRQYRTYKQPTSKYLISDNVLTVTI